MATTITKEGSFLKALARFSMLHNHEATIQEVTEDLEVEPPRITTRVSLNPTEDLLSATNKHTEVVKNYLELASRPTLSNEDLERMDSILSQAESDSALSFLIGEADYLIGQRMGLFNPNDPNAFADQQAWLREHLETSNDFSQIYAQEFQELLKEKGFYKGAVDGVIGELTATALIKFQKQHSLIIDGVPGVQTYVALWTGDDYYRELQTLLQEQEYYDGDIDGIWGVKSRTALFEFQISHNDVNADGFPGPRTYLALKAHSQYFCEVQEMLQKLGFYQRTPDGVIGQRTRLALKKFQASVGLTVDGIPGETTYLALKAACLV